MMNALTQYNEVFRDLFSLKFDYKIPLLQNKRVLFILFAVDHSQIYTVNKHLHVHCTCTCTPN